MTVNISAELLHKVAQATSLYAEVLQQLISEINEERWVSPADAQAETGIDAQNIRRLARAGRIKSQKKGQKLVVVSLSDVKEYASTRV